MDTQTKAITSNTPAIAGGTPVKNTPFGSAKRYGQDELEQLKEALDQGSLFYTHGSKVRGMEERIAEVIGVKHAIATSSGTASIHAALIAAGISPGDEVIVTPITDMGSLVPILWQGAIPVFADLDPHTYNLDPESVESKITPKTRAVLAVHLWGNSCDLDALNSICDKRGIVLIEDCAQSWGCTYNGHAVGSIGTIGCFSLNEFKHIACGDGGVVVTNDEKLAKRLRLATDKAYERDPSVAMRNPTFLANNYRMTELQGAVALAQIDKLDSIIERRRRFGTKLTSRIAGVPGVFAPKPTEKCDPSYWFFMIRIDPDVLGIDADKFAEAIRAEGLSAGAHYIGQCVYEYPVFVNHSAFERGSHPYEAVQYGKGMCPVAEEILDTSVLMPLNENYTDQDLEDMVRGITRVAEWFASNKE